MWGVAPTRRGPFVSAKGPKTISARLRPQGGPSAKAPNPSTPLRTSKMARELVESTLSLIEGLKQLSPKCRFGASAPQHPKAGGPQNKTTSNSLDHSN